MGANKMNNTQQMRRAFMVTQDRAVTQRSSSAANAVVLLRFYAAFITGNSDAAVQFVTPDFIMHVPGTGINAGKYWGHDGLRTFMNNIRTYNGGTFRMHVPAMAVDDHTAFTREVVILNRKQDPAWLWTLRFMMHYEFKNGAISEAWTIPEDQYVYDAYWNPLSSTGTNNSVQDIETMPGHSLPELAGATSSYSKDLVNTFYNRFWNGDMTGMQQLAADDVIFYVPGRSHLAGEYRTWAGYLAFRDKLIKLAGDKYKLEIASIAASETDIFVKEYIRMNRKKDPTVQTIYVILHFEIRNDKIVRINDIPVDTYSYEAFFQP
jgi:ketosteroid isomerase-like protein